MLKPTTSFILLLLWWLSFALPHQASAQDATELTPTELFNVARTAFDSGDWAKAETLFTKFIDTYGAVAETAEAARRLKPLLVSAKLRQKKYAETLPLLEEVLEDPQLDPGSSDELAFWKGICQFQVQDFDAAQKAFGEFYGEKQPYVARLNEVQRRVHAGRRTESVLLYGMCFLMKDDFKGAAAFYGRQIASLRQVNREAAGRATVLRFHALLECDDSAEALALVKETAAHVQDITQAVAYQVLCLQLGAGLLEDGQFYESIYVLQRIGSREKILSSQKASEALFASRLEIARKTPGQEYLAYQYESLITRIQRELDQFEKMASFDAALRLRVATAYRELGRYRECALILEEMLHGLPQDEVVKKASLSLVQCWMQINRWDKAVAAADEWLEKFGSAGSDPEVPVVMHLKAVALHAGLKANEAELVFATVHQKHPQHALAPQCLFMEGICLLEQDLNREALDAFAEVPKRFPAATAVVEDAWYWGGMALSLDKQHAAARSRMEDYLKRYTEKGAHAAEARFRIAFSSFGLAEHPRAIHELGAFIKKEPGTLMAEEAKLLLGDALGAEGRIDEALKVYPEVNPKLNARFAEEAVFRMGNIYKLAERFDEMQDHFSAFVRDHPRSARVAEAVYWLSWIHDTTGHREEARKVAWDAVAAHGNDREARGVEDVLAGMARLYPGGEGKTELKQRLDVLAGDARERKQEVLAIRLEWASAMSRQREDADSARQQLAAMSSRINPRVQSSRIAVDVADALRESGRLPLASAHYREIRKWHPRALEKDRVFLGLGLIAVQENLPEEALKAFVRFERETTGSPLLAQLAFTKGGLYTGLRRYPEAQGEFERLLQMPTAPRKLKAEAILQLGDLQVSQKQDLKATAYYERVYVSYGKYATVVAPAYLKRAEALERLSEPVKALEVYRELALREDLKGTPEQSTAMKRLDAGHPGWRNPPSEAAPPPTTAATP